MATSGTKETILDALVENARRSEWLREYAYDLELPLLLNPPESPLACRETTAEFEAINSSFSSQIRALFEALQEFTSTHGDEFIRQDGLRPTIRIINQSFDIYPHCLHRYYHSRRLFLRDDDATQLPQLQRVTTLKLTPRSHLGSLADDLGNTRPVSLRLLLQLACRLPALRELDCPWLWERLPFAYEQRALCHYSRPWEGPWRDARHEFGRAVRELGAQLPGSLRKARLWFWHPHAFYDKEDQSIPMPNLIRPEDADPVSLGVRILASRLEELDLRAFLTPDLFRSPVEWPHMKRLRVEFHPWCPDGTWYFVGPRGDNDEEENRESEGGDGFEISEEHYPPLEPNELDDEMDEEYVEEIEDEEEYLPKMFRTEPFSRKIEPLLLAFAEALKGMPVLEKAELFSYLAWQVTEERLGPFKNADEAPNCAIYRWGVSYTPGPGTNGASGQITWQVGAWRPQEHVLRAFEALGGETGQVDINWEPLDFLNQRNDLKPGVFM